MRTVLLILTILVIVGCGSEQAEQTKISFPVLSGCHEDIKSYFENESIKLLGIKHSITKINRRIMGLEHVIGFAEVSSDSFNSKELMSFVNGALGECTPSAMVLIEKEDPIYKRINEIKNYKFTIYKKGTMLTKVTDRGIEVYGNFEPVLPKQGLLEDVQASSKK